ncbi:multicopper polyphenol oxidase [Luteitalea sp. TBR-22]|uniref:peptidoglycan editing factor PgeF n=1 Tax=Luteitalea sp. TBR-22 TaxID=2802971 RepID=UPI001AF65CCC|nr:peptidoglycan editing factor PgeF [Luteitalea sp. TBR-22]BCS35649.1 multicopper polyphenol oxidase [Luteitalea sp. TBR-22]
MLPAPMPPFEWVDTPWGTALQCAALRPYARHVFSARGLDVPHADAGEGWGLLASWIGVATDDVWRLRQVHGVEAHTHGVAPCDGTWPAGDLLATDRHDVALAIRTADCVPLLYADARGGAVAAVHAGWRGTVAGASGRMVEIMRARFGTAPADLVVAIGPCVGPDAYEVGQDVVDAFAATWPAEVARGTWWRAGATAGKYLLDLWTITRDQLALAGVAPERMHLAGLCTVTHHDVLHSYRVDGAAAGRMVAAIRRRS